MNLRVRDFQLFDEYQEAAATTAKIIKQIPPDAYTVLGLCGEAGEVAEKVKKFYRDGGDRETVREAVRKELGDVLWYLSETARHWGLLLSDVACGNLEKLKDRRDRDVISGSGDNR